MSDAPAGTAIPLLGQVQIRPAAVDDAGALAAAYARNRDHLQPWEPVRGESFYTEAGQHGALAAAAAEQAAGRGLSWVLVDGGIVVGRISLTDIVRGAFQNGHLGYWIDRNWQGRGLATAAVRHACGVAAGLGLHRLQAATLLHNAASQTVLDRCGFAAIGTAEKYLRIDGGWQDHILFQKLLTD